MPVANYQSSKVAAAELSSASKFNNFVQAAEDATNAIDNSKVSSAAAIAVSKLAAGSNSDVLTTVAGVPTWQAAAASTLPPGMVAPYGGSSAPSGWLLCDASAVSRTTYAALFAIVGTSYGVGDGATTFNLPDTRGRVPAGKGTHVDVDALGDSDGMATVADRRPAHKHTLTHASVAAIEGATYNVGTGGNLASTQSITIGPQTNSPTDQPAFVVFNYIIKT